MVPNHEAILEVRQQIVAAEALLQELRHELDRLQSPTYACETKPRTEQPETQTKGSLNSLKNKGARLGWTASGEIRASDYQRYGRQMILPELIENADKAWIGQIALKQKSVLIVGLGGLGCPAATYLAGAGVGKIGLMDGDVVELSNLHRQILHSTASIGRLKVESVRDHLRRQNPDLQYDIYPFHLRSADAVRVFGKYDIILDCTDRPATRYMISDAAVMARRPVVSASALKTEGQLMILNHPSGGSESLGNSSFCYRCIFPKPPPPEGVTSCGEGGILGPVVGVMGVLMALETIKILLAGHSVSAQGHKPIASALPPSLLLFSAFSSPQFRTIRLRGKRSGCQACSSSATINASTLESGAMDYDTFCGMRQSLHVLDNDERESVVDYNDDCLRQRGPHSILADVRERVEFDLAHIQGSVSLPFSSINDDPQAALDTLRHKIRDSKQYSDSSVNLICRFGNDSQLAARLLQDAMRGSGHQMWTSFKDVRGGLDAWRRDIDATFPEY